MPSSGSRGDAVTGLVLVSHSALLAGGIVELAAQMAPDVVLRPAGGTDDARLGTSFDVVERAVGAVLDAGCTGVAVLADIGSARMTAEAVIEALDDPRVYLAAGAFVEGAVAAAVACQTGTDLAGVVATVAAATRQLAEELPQETPPASGAGAPEREGALTATVEVRMGQGLHARPAAQLAALVAEFDADVRLGGVDAASLLSLMGLGLTKGATAVVEATGPQAQAALTAVVAAFEEGFGEL